MTRFLTWNYYGNATLYQFYSIHKNSDDKKKIY